MWLFKKKSVPETNNTKEIDVIKAYVVRYQSFEQLYSYVDSTAYPKKQAEFFVNKEEAVEFVESLKNANKILKNKTNLNISIEEN